MAFENQQNKLPTHFSFPFYSHSLYETHFSTLNATEKKPGKTLVFLTGAMAAQPSEAAHTKTNLRSRCA